MFRHDKYCPEKGSRGVNRLKIGQNVSKIALFLVSKTGPPKRIFLIINRYDYCNEYSTNLRLATTTKRITAVVQVVVTIITFTTIMITTIIVMKMTTLPPEILHAHVIIHDKTDHRTRLTI